MAGSYLWRFTIRNIEIEHKGINHIEISHIKINPIKIDPIEIDHIEQKLLVRYNTVISLYLT